MIDNSGIKEFGTYPDLIARGVNFAQYHVAEVAPALSEMLPGIALEEVVSFMTGVQRAELIIDEGLSNSIAQVQILGGSYEH